MMQRLFPVYGSGLVDADKAYTSFGGRLCMESPENKKRPFSMYGSDHTHKTTFHVA